LLNTISQVRKLGRAIAMARRPD